MSKYTPARQAEINFALLLCMADMGPAVKSASILVTHLTTVVVTRRHKHRKNASREEFVVTIGRPNWKHRNRVRAFERAGKAYPQRVPHLTFYPQKKK